MHFELGTLVIDIVEVGIKLNEIVALQVLGFGLIRIEYQDMSVLECPTLIPS